MGDRSISIFSDYYSLVLPPNLRHHTGNGNIRSVKVVCKTSQRKLFAHCLNNSALQRHAKFSPYILYINTTYVEVCYLPHTRSGEQVQ